MRTGVAAPATALARWLALGLALAAACGGCTSDPAGPVGADLPTGPGFEALLVPLRADTAASWGRVEVTEAVRPFSREEVLYLGRRDGEQSSIVARYDFSAPVDTLPAGLDVSVGNIVAVRLRLYGLKFYEGGPFRKYYEVWNLAAPLDTLAYPGAEPERAGRVAGVEAIGWQVSLPVPPSAFVAWYQAVAPNGIVITEGAALPDQEPAIVGFASKENVHPASTLPDSLREGTVLGPVIQVEFADPPNTFIRWQPTADLSTLSSLRPLPNTPEAGFAVRTHRRSYPFLSFSLASLPAGAFIHRAELIVTKDTPQSYGPPESIVCCELPLSAVPDDVNSLELADLAARAKVITGFTSVVPDTLPARLNFNVTATLQRWVNGVFTEPVGFLLCAGEDFAENYDMASVDPEYYLSRFQFLGTAAADSLDRPYLKVRYSLPGRVEGGIR